ncbi:sulfate adenylyltransferase [Thermaurantimonas aggregans]|uniref:Sulfate adenylyltransferase subunit 2 n=1 Tax=Thermaurantimonas aggregans TaxID=2173829 RepID=A0A401XJS1_9FLAO|nr:sulfate adenylyltransferase subunit CysD [Thermaurantimonas aggregans]MCX8149239.1 sulfate adenylyltransferase subunit 2 [Thermaurantimonas aggregans]GCD77221.1 sulfate adenylyltransferase [Thermaurantimonas aggregans]
MTTRASDYLLQLVDEAVEILYITARHFKNAMILFSGGKDSITLSHIAYKAFYPAPPPFKLLQVDTGHNFPEAMEYRDWFVRHFGYTLEVADVQKAIDRGLVTEPEGPDKNRNRIQSAVLLDYVRTHNVDALLGGGRRDEDRARAKERIFSHRDVSGSWRPENQRTELGTLAHLSIAEGEHFRIFPLSNWTELDVWYYIREHNLPVPSLYFAKPREVIFRNGAWVQISPYIALRPDETPTTRSIRFRTLGDITITGGIESKATTVEDIIRELESTLTSERGHRHDDRQTAYSMEVRKREGYF